MIEIDVSTAYKLLQYAKQEEDALHQILRSIQVEGARPGGLDYLKKELKRCQEVQVTLLEAIDR